MWSVRTAFKIAGRSIVSLSPLLCLLFLCSAQARGQWEWLSPEQYLKQSTLIAILNVGTVHQAWTPEHILIESATAKVERVIYYEFAEDAKKMPVEKLPDTIVLYRVEPNANIVDGHGFSSGVPALPTLEPGRVFARLKEQGENKFVPYDGLSLQRLDGNKVRWPTKPGYTDDVPIDLAIEQLQKLQQSIKPESANGP